MGAQSSTRSDEEKKYFGLAALRENFLRRVLFSPIAYVKD